MSFIIKDRELIFDKNKQDKLKIEKKMTEQIMERMKIKNSLACGGGTTRSQIRSLGLNFLLLQSANGSFSFCVIIMIVHGIIVEISCFKHRT